jgi:hypothetical protein
MLTVLCHLNLKVTRLPPSRSLVPAQAKPDPWPGIKSLSEAGICHLLRPHRIEIQDRFWPYERDRPKSSGEDAAVYVAEVRRMFLSQCCVCSSFSAPMNSWRRTGAGEALLYNRSSAQFCWEPSGSTWL